MKESKQEWEEEDDKGVTNCTLKNEWIIKLRLSIIICIAIVSDTICIQLHLKHKKYLLLK